MFYPHIPLYAMKRNTELRREIAREAPFAREPTDGERYDKNGDIRPVPPGVPNAPEEERHD
jgi:hypothetical protein